MAAVLAVLGQHPVHLCPCRGAMTADPINGDRPAATWAPRTSSSALCWLAPFVSVRTLQANGLSPMDECPDPEQGRGR